jgi:hypothetical protein
MKKLYTIALCALTVAMATAKPTNIKPSTITDWKSIGTCEFTEDILSNLTDHLPKTYDVKVEESESHPGYYRIVNPYGKNTPIYGKINNYVLDSSADHYLYINAMDPEAVFMPISDLRMAEEWDDYGETSLTVMTKGYYNAIVDEYGYSSLEEQAELGHMGRLADGYITFPANEIYLCIGDNRWGGDDANLSGAFALKLPGAKNYRISDLIISSYCAGEKESMAWNGIGGACAQAYYHCVKGHVTDEAIAEAITDGQPLIEDLGDGYYYCIYSAYMKEDIKNDTENTLHTGFIVTVDEDNNVKGVYSKEFYTIPENADKWENIGTGTFTDAILSGFYGDKKPKTYQVAVEQRVDRPGYYRIVNPYGEGYPDYTAEAFSAKHAHNHYIFIDATDPDAVILEEAPVGADYGKVGDARISSTAAQALANGSMTLSDVKSKKMCGTLKDGTITFPKKTLLFSERSFIAGNWRQADKNGKTALVLPTPTGISSVAAESAQEAVYYNLQGVRVAAPENGIYLRRTGDKVEKVVIR